MTARKPADVGVVLLEAIACGGPGLARWSGQRTPAPPTDTATEGAGILSPGRMFSGRHRRKPLPQCLPGLPHGRRRGAVGAGSYPSLAGDSNIGAAAYPVHVVVDGLRGMPAFGHAP